MGGQFWIIIFDWLAPDQVAAANAIVNNPSLPLTNIADELNNYFQSISVDVTVTPTDVQAYRDYRYTNYFLSSRSSVVQLETLEISHPNFSQVYRIVRNATAGLVATIETGGTAEFEYYPVKIVPHHARDDLDHSISATFGDLGEILPKEMDLVMKAPGGMKTKPTVKYRVFRSDDLSAPIYGPLRLEVEAFSFNKEGATFEAKAPSINLTRTGEVYSFTRFPGLRGFL